MKKPMTTDELKKEIMSVIEAALPDFPERYRSAYCVTKWDGESISVDLRGMRGDRWENYELTEQLQDRVVMAAELGGWVPEPAKEFEWSFYSPHEHSKQFSGALEEVYEALRRVPGFKNLSLDRQGELAVELMQAVEGTEL